jgi:hypothetical protein
VFAWPFPADSGLKMETQSGVTAFADFTGIRDATVEPLRNIVI